MNIYSILFDRLYSVFHKGASTNPIHEKIDGAVLTSMIISIPVFFNVLTIFHLIRVMLNRDMFINVKFGIIVMISLMTFNLIYFLRKKKYLEASLYVSSVSKNKRLVYTAISWTYFIGSFVLFFLLLNIGKD